jgi:hypothetical protein
MMPTTRTLTAVPHKSSLPTRSSTGVSARRRANSRGNVMVECAFTVLPIFALILGFIDVGMMIFRWATLQNAVREGCRYAITLQTSGGLGQDASIEQVVQSYAMGLAQTTDSPNRIMVNYFQPTDLNTPIASGGNVPGNIVQVSVQGIPFSWIMPLSGSFNGSMYASSPLTLNVYSLDMLGGYPPGVTSVAR